MSSTKQQDRLLGGGISLPQWMKGRADSRFDFDESTLSPPSHDDSFFYIRYPKTQNRSSDSKQVRPIDKALNEQESFASPVVNVTTEQTKSVIESKTNEEIDRSKHSLTCQPFVSTSTTNKASEIGYPTNLSKDKARTKYQGINDGYHRESVVCGKSIVLVASQMMSNKFHEPFTAEPTEPAESQPKRGSKSLPATPLASPIQSPNSSPKARRRVPSNRYFTGSFLFDREKYQGGWILGSILGQSREIVTAKIDEEDETNADVSIPPAKTLSRKRSISSQNLTYVGSDEKSADKSTIATNMFRAKPSELREMNFWSPTSM